MPLDKNIKYTSMRKKIPLILVTNDDGYNAAGLRELATALKKVGDVLVVAPAVEQSAMSHTLTLHRPLRCRKVARNFYVVDGTPTDCVNLAVNFILKGRRPDLLFSGINQGPNLGDDVHYSATVSAAVEGGIIGIPSAAVSVAGSLAGILTGGVRYKFRPAAAFAARVARQMLKRGLPEDIILNINVPNTPMRCIRGYKITIQGKKNYSNITTEKIDPRGDKYYWISGEEVGFDDIPGSDCNAIAAGYISITPVRVDPTDRHVATEMKKWRF